MKVKTRDFGEVTIQEDAVVEFVQPLFGFEKYRKFAFLYDQELGEEIVWLQSVEEVRVCFILMNPAQIFPGYAPRLPEQAEALLGEGEWICWVIAVIPGELQNATVNLKSPVIVNLKTGRGAQIILEQDYPIRFPVMKGAE